MAPAFLLSLKPAAQTGCGLVHFGHPRRPLHLRDFQRQGMLTFDLVAVAGVHRPQQQAQIVRPFQHGPCRHSPGSSGSICDGSS